jgi:uncharacterized protein (DUF2062 family)
VSTYNDGTVLAGVVEGVKRHLDAVVVVDDGSTDGTGEVTGAIAGIEVVRHERTRGKGAALASGFEWARERRFTHAVTIDGDGRHLARDIPLLLEAIRRDPDAIWIGERERTVSGAPAKGRFAGRLSDFWVRAETGARVPDSRCGFRAYPLERVSDLRLRASRHAFEVEVLVKASWTGTALRSLPVHAFCPEDRVSHFRPVRDLLAISVLNTRLLLMRLLLPMALRQLVSSRRLSGEPFGRKLGRASKLLLNDGTLTPARVAASVGLGVCMGIFPIWGYQMLAALLLAGRLGLSPVIAVVASNISIPVAMPFILYASLVSGRLVLERELDLSISFGGDVWAAIGGDLTAYLVGAVVLSLAAGFAAGLMTYPVARLVSWFRSRRRRA